MDTFLPQPQPPPITSTTVHNAFTAPNPFAVPTIDPSRAQDHVNHTAANPTLVPDPSSGYGISNHQHPPYAEMITAAIAALKERDGSSKRAIAKYIEGAYTGLPSTHSALLTHHLKRLKNNGLLIMVKKSYKLPISDSSSTASPAANLPSSGPNRGRGRPPKPKPNPTSQPISQPIVDPVAQPAIQPVTQHAIQPTIQPFGQPSVQFNGQTTGQATAQINGQPSAQPVLVALGLVDDPSPVSVKRGPGRPRKGVEVGVSQGETTFVKKGRGRPPGSKAKLPGPRLPKKSPGRPRKPKSVTGVSGSKRGPGRPSKAEPNTMVIPYVTNVPIGVVDQTNNIPDIVSVPPRSRGRPRKIGVSAGTAAGAGIFPAKRQGRPSKVAGVQKLKNPMGRSVGRPKKNGRASSVASDSLTAANVDLKTKVDYFQTKVRQAVSTLKPLLTHESPVAALAAVQELEELATLDVSAPLKEEVQVQKG
ncbi:hypothetical protein UlMin_027189 [Ulmus minor]